MRLFYVSNNEEFSFCHRKQCSYNERNTVKLRRNCERNFDGAFSFSFEINFFWVLFFFLYVWPHRVAHEQMRVSVTLVAYQTDVARGSE